LSRAPFRLDINIPLSPGTTRKRSIWITPRFVFRNRAGRRRQFFRPWTEQYFLFILWLALCRCDNRCKIGNICLEIEMNLLKIRVIARTSLPHFGNATIRVFRVGGRISVSFFQSTIRGYYFSRFWDPRMNPFKLVTFKRKMVFAIISRGRVYTLDNFLNCITKARRSGQLYSCVFLSL
jgi:hypothetical protein